MLFMDVPGDGTVDLGCAQVNDPRNPAPVSGFEEVAQLRFTPRAGGPGALHHRRYSVAGGVHLAWIGQITTHDFNRQSPDPRGAGPFGRKDKDRRTTMARTTVAPLMLTALLALGAPAIVGCEAAGTSATSV